VSSGPFLGTCIDVTDSTDVRGELDATKEATMSIGAGVFVLALGAILAFAVTDRINNIDLTAIGYILMAVAILGMALSWAFSNRRRSRETAIDPEVEAQYRMQGPTPGEREIEVQKVEGIRRDNEKLS
jgi:uncharacterized protein DUF6458